LISVFLLGGVLGTGFGVAAGFSAFPYVFPPPVAMDRLTADERTVLAATGTFIHADPSDPIHYGKGKVSVCDRVVFLDKDFEVDPGPKFHVYLVPAEKIRGSSQVKNTMYVDVGRLRSSKGNQKYNIPAGIDLKKYPSVVIWCEQFGVLISAADLKFGA
jgi:hypothetical protein